ncbi:hypothetical protein GCM10009814_24050 [Lapillicoccus jejuensis]
MTGTGTGSGSVGVPMPTTCPPWAGTGRGRVAGPAGAAVEAAAAALVPGPGEAAAGAVRERRTDPGRATDRPVAEGARRSAAAPVPVTGGTALRSVDGAGVAGAGADCVGVGVGVDVGVGVGRGVADRVVAGSEGTPGTSRSVLPPAARDEPAAPSSDEDADHGAEGPATSTAVATSAPRGAGPRRAADRRCGATSERRDTRGPSGAVRAEGATRSRPGVRRRCGGCVGWSCARGPRPVAAGASGREGPRRVWGPGGGRTTSRSSCGGTGAAGSWCCRFVVLRVERGAAAVGRGPVGVRASGVGTVRRVAAPVGGASRPSDR